MKVPVSPARLKLLTVTGPSTLLVPVSRWPVWSLLSSSTLTVSLASLKSSLTAVMLWPSNTLAKLYALVPPPVASTVAPVVTMAEESISFTVRLGAAPLKSAAGTKRSWSAAFKVKAVAAPLMLDKVLQLVPSEEYCHEPLVASAL